MCKKDQRRDLRCVSGKEKQRITSKKEKNKEKSGERERLGNNVYQKERNKQTIKQIEGSSVKSKIVKEE